MRVSRCVALALVAAIVAGGGARDVAAAGRPVALAGPDGNLLAGQLYEAAVRPAPGVVLVHMLGRHRADWDGMATALQAAGVTALALDLRGHGASAGSPEPHADMARDVATALRWLATRPEIRPDALGLAGASLGASLVLLAAPAEPVRALALVSPGLEYRGLRAGPELMRKLAGRAVWMAASADDPYALRTMKDLTVDGPIIDQQVSAVAAHGTRLLAADHDLAASLVDWLRQRLIF